MHMHAVFSELIFALKSFTPNSLRENSRYALYTDYARTSCIPRAGYYNGNCALQYLSSRREAVLFFLKSRSHRRLRRAGRAIGVFTEVVLKGPLRNYRYTAKCRDRTGCHDRPEFLAACVANLA